MSSEKEGPNDPPFRICAVFPELEEQHLPKEVVQLPYHLGRLLDAESRVVSIDREGRPRQTERMAPGVRFDILPNKGRSFFVERGLIRYLFDHSRSIDLLVLFHFQKRSYFLAVLYKMLNPKGMLYLKGDVYNQRLKEGTASYSPRPFFRPLLRFLEKAAFRAIDLISVENREAHRIFNDRYPDRGEKCIFLPSGIDSLSIQKVVPEPLPLNERPYRILVVGRLGLHVKGHDVLLKALEGVDPKAFEIRFIGPELGDLKERKEALFRKRPDLRNAVRFIGRIPEREDLYKEYAMGRFLCLPSRAESFGLVLLEAGAFGVIPIGTDAIDSFDEITQKGRFGSKVPSEDPEALRKVLQAHIDDPEGHQREAEAYREHVLRCFDWRTVIGKLHEELAKRSGKRPYPSGKR